MWLPSAIAGFANKADGLMLPRIPLALLGRAPSAYSAFLQDPSDPLSGRLAPPRAEGEPGECRASSTDGMRWTQTATSHPDIGLRSPRQRQQPRNEHGPCRPMSRRTSWFRGSPVVPVIPTCPILGQHLLHGGDS